MSVDKFQYVNPNMHLNNQLTNAQVMISFQNVCSWKLYFTIISLAYSCSWPTSQDTIILRFCLNPLTSSFSVHCFVLCPSRYCLSHSLSFQHFVNVAFYHNNISSIFLFIFNSNTYQPSMSQPTISILVSILLTSMHHMKMESRTFVTQFLVPPLNLEEYFYKFRFKYCFS